MSKRPNESSRDAKARATAPPDPDYAAAVAAARPKVKELLAEYQSNPTGDAAGIVEALVLSQMAGQPAREAEVVHSQQERDLCHNLVDNAGRNANRLVRQNHRLKRDLAQKNVVHAYVREYLKEVGAAILKGHEPTPQEMIEKVSAAIGLRGPLIPRVEKGAPPDFFRVGG